MYLPKLTIRRSVTYSVLAIVGFMLWYSLIPQRVQYRMTVELEHNGKIETASSIINAYYRHQDYSFLPNITPFNWTGSYKGTAPIFNLSDGGTLIASLHYSAYAIPENERKRVYPEMPHRPLSA